MSGVVGKGGKGGKGSKLFQLRRSSTSVTPAPPSNTGDPNAQRGTEAYIASDASGNASMSTPSFPETEMSTPQARMIRALVSRLREALPVNSGNSLVFVESDVGLNQTVEMLIEQSRGCPDFAVLFITDTLYGLNKRRNPILEDDVPYLQSRLFLLKLLYYVLANRSSNFTKETHQGSDGKSSTVASTGRSSPAIRFHESVLKKKSYGSESIDSNKSPSSSILDAKPITDDISRYVLGTICPALRDAPDLSAAVRSAASMDADSLADEFETCDEVSTPFTILTSQLRTAGPVVTLQYGVPGNERPKVFGRSHFSDLRTSEALADTASSLIKLSYKFASHVVFYLSATNWDAVFAKVQKNLRGWTKIGNSGKVAQGDFVLASCCAFDRARLVQFIQEVHSLFVSLPTEVHPQIAFAIRRAVWRWIQIFPIEFAEVLQNNKKLENHSQKLYDWMLNRLDDSNKVYMWPALTALLIISNDKMQEAEHQFSNPGERKKYGKKRNNLWEQLTRALNEPASSSLSNVALACHIDVIQATVLLPGNLEGVSITSFVPDVTDTVFRHLSRPVSSRLPFYLSADPIEVTLYSDAIIALYPRKSKEVLGEIISPALDIHRSYASKLVVIRALIGITVEYKKCPPNIAYECMRPLYETVVPRTLSIYSTYASRRSERTLEGIEICAAPTPTMKWKVGMEDFCGMKEYDLLGIGCIALFRADIAFIVPSGEIQAALFDPRQSDWVREVADIYQRAHPDRARLASLRAYELFQDPSSLLVHGKDYQLYIATWVAISNPAVVRYFAKCSLDASVEPFEEVLFSRLVKDNLTWWASRENHEISKMTKYSKDRASSLALAEIACLSLLTSTQSVVCIYACEALQLLALAEHHPEARRTTHFNEDVQAKRLLVYEQILDPVLNSYGRICQQRKIRQMICGLASPSIEYFSVWMVCFAKFSAMEKKSERRHLNGDASSYSSFVSDERAKWSNLLYFLACWAGCTNIKEPRLQVSSALPSDSIPEVLQHHFEPAEERKRFLRTCIDELIIGISVERRMDIVDALGNELHPDAIRDFMAVLDEKLILLFDVNLEPEFSSQVRTYLESFMNILQGLLSRNDERTASALSAIEFDSIIMITKYLDGLDLFLDGLEQKHDSDVLILREKLCCLCEGIVQRRSILGLRADRRNELLHRISSWIPGTELFLRHGTTPSEYVHRLYYRAAIQCLRTSVKLSDRLVLQGEQGPVMTSGGELGPNPFREYLNHFRCASWLVNPKVAAVLKDERSSGTISHTSQQDIEDLVIQGITNLLLANPDIGTSPCLELAVGESADTNSRHIACVLFAQVLQKGTKLDCATVSAPKSYKNVLCEFLRETDICLPKTVLDSCTAGEMDDKPIVSSLLAIYDKTPSLLNLCLHAVSKEFDECKIFSQLFRQSSGGTVLLTRMARLQGAKYIRSVLNVAVSEIGKAPEVALLDSKPGEAAYDAQPLAQMLSNAVGQVIEQMQKSLRLLPVIIFQVCNYITMKAKERELDDYHAPLANFVILRFICPALSDPSYAHYEGRVTSEEQKGLTVLAKILIQLSHNNTFPSHARLSAMNSFLPNHSRPIADFVRAISTIPKDRVKTEPLEATIRYDEADGIFMQQYFSAHADILGTTLLSIDKSAPQGVEEFKRIKSIWDACCAALVEVGDPPAPVAITSDPTASQQLLTAHLRRYRHQSSKLVENYFVKLPCSHTDRAYFLLPLSQISVENTDFEQLAAYVLKILTDLASPFDIVFDCTGFSTSSELPIPWINLIFQITPERVVRNFKTAYLVCTNILAQNYIRKLYAIYHNISLADEAFVVPNFRVISELDTNFQLPPDYEGIKLEERPLYSYEHIELRGDNLEEQMTLEITSSHLRLTTTRRNRVFTTKEAMATEIIWLSEITDAYDAGEKQGFVISRRSDRLHFYSKQNGEIIKNIKEVKTSAKFLPSKLVRGQSFNPSELTASLLHIALWNSCSSEEHLSKAAQGLLSALTRILAPDKAQGTAMKAVLHQNPTIGIPTISDKLAFSFPSYTLPLLSRFCEQYHTGTNKQKLDSLQVFGPWIRNLATFRDPMSSLLDDGSTLRPAILDLVELDFREPEYSSAFQKHIWGQLKELDSSFLAYVLDILIPTACESREKGRAVANICSSVPSYTLWTKLFAKLRKAMGKLVPEPSAADDSAWSEVQALVNVCYRTTQTLRTTNSLPRYQSYPPDLLSVIPVLANVGPLSFRLDVYGLTITFLQALFSTNDERSQITPVLQDWTKPDALRLFGLKGDPTTGRYQIAEDTPHADRLSMTEVLAQQLLRMLSRSGHKSSLQNAWRTRFMSLTTSCAFLTNPLWVKTRALTIVGALLDTESTVIDNDFFYQLVSVTRQFLEDTDPGNPLPIISLYHTLTRLCRYINLLPVAPFGRLVWFAIKAVSISTVPTYPYACELLLAAVWCLDRNKPLLSQIIDDLRELPKTMIRDLENYYSISFEGEFSISLAYILFLGARPTATLEDYKRTVETLMDHVVAMSRRVDNVYGDLRRPIYPEVLGFFLGLLPFVNDEKGLKALIKRAGGGDKWNKNNETELQGHKYKRSSLPPRVPIEVFGNMDNRTALILCSFISMMLKSCRPDGVEATMLFTLLGDLSGRFADVVGLCCEGLVEGMLKDVSTSSNVPLLNAVELIFRLTLDDEQRSSNHRVEHRHSVSSLGSTFSHTENQRSALRQLGMDGIALNPIFIQNNKLKECYKSLSTFIGVLFG